MSASQLALFPAAEVFDAAGLALCESLDAEFRRAQGITLTPGWLVDLMLQRLAAAGPFQTIVDPGAGSGRFCIAAAKRFPGARVVAVERSEAMLAVLRSNLKSEGLADRVEVVPGDFRDVRVELSGRAAFVGNPPYVRHHGIEPAWKLWYATTMARFGQRASKLAGLHLHFLARVAELARPGDQLCFVTSAEWLDTGYGSAWRALLCDRAGPLMVQGLWVAEPQTPVFPDALVSALVLQAEMGTRSSSVSLGVLQEGALSTSRVVPIASLQGEQRWTSLCQTELTVPTVGIEVGELFKVTRGQVTGLNDAWVLPAGSEALPLALTVPAVTRAKEIIDGTVEAADGLGRLRRVVSLPADLGCLPAALRVRVDAFLATARALGAADGYVARQRRAWHALDLRIAPAAMVSYMGRRAPVFRANPHAVSFLNIAHGLYPRQPLSGQQLRPILDFLNVHTDMRAGRMYGGGMAKFEPSDIARLRIPPAILEPAD